jgi:hypothetical protein
MQTGENSVESNESQDWTRPLSQNWPDKKYKSARRWHRYEFTLHFREHVVMRTEEFAIRLFFRKRPGGHFLRTLDAGE